MSDSTKLKFGVIGHGFIGKTHVQSIQKHPQAELHAIFSQPEDKDEIPDGVTFYTDWEELLDNDAIDCVLIATPTPTHAEIAKKSAQNGKAMIIEKPMTRSLEEAEELIQMIKKTKAIAFVGHVLRFWPSYYLAKQEALKRDSSIGDLKMIRLQRISGFPSWASWFLDEEQSGGVILDLSIHDLDYACDLMGELPETVYCEGQKIPVNGHHVLGISMTTLRFPGNRIAYCEGSWAARPTFPFTVTTEIIGSEGIIEFDSTSRFPLNICTNQSAMPLDPMEYDGYYRELDSFIQSVLNQTPPEVSVEDGRNAVALSLAALQSIQEKRPVAMKEVLP